MKKQLLVLSDGAVGETTVEKLRDLLDKGEWDITIVDREQVNTLEIADVEREAPPRNRLALTDGRLLPYDYLVFA